MEGVVAKRTLRKSFYGENSLNYDETCTRREPKPNHKHSLKEKIIFKFWLQTITVGGILLFVFCIKFLNIKVVKESDIVKKLSQEFKKTYTIKDIKRVSKNISLKTYALIKPIIPNDLKNNIINGYKKIINKTNIVSGVNVYEETSNYKGENKEKSVGGSVEDKNAVASVSSSVSMEVATADEIKETNISFIKPVSGIITSRFGAREVVFEGVDSYHTGIDIATDTGTKVVSSMAGTVKVAQYNKYNGNYIEIKDGKVVTKYCHLNKILVKVGDKVKAGTVIGEVGSTGLATGPHLHFELVYDGKKINPELILKF